MDDTSLILDNKTFVLTQEQPGESQYLIVKDLKNRVLDEIVLEKEYDPYKFGATSLGKRNVAIIAGRHQFFVLDCNSNQIIKKFKATKRGYAQDGQSGVFCAYKFIDNSKYLLANALDFGLFCYDIKNLNNIKTVHFYKSDSIYFKGKYYFLDLDQDDYYNMLLASCGNYKTEIKSEILFKDI
ncbi:hypothetical protein [Sunxiuqinia sp. A32]|uniref:hypothetical protein n=1 Tax=Sunxiuqinia sp. A32 TaxID=3461496 RepID=UPI0040454535